MILTLYRMIKVNELDLINLFGFTEPITEEGPLSPQHGTSLKRGWGG